MPTRRTFDKAEFLPNDNSTPHIVPDVLYPAIGGKLLDGTTSHSGNYGTSQTDSRKYYYTDIKGSKPIKDPRIGAHFGSQRHKCKSVQILEQETAMQGENIYSIDGREWCRGHVGGTQFGSDSAEILYFEDTSNFLEIVGYFSDVNIQFHNISGRNVQYTLDGVDDSTNYAGGVSITTPLAGRYVEAGGVENLGLGATLGIHTLKLRQTTSGHANSMVGFELIAQVTTNAVTRNKIQIPSQTVFSFGSKFTVGGSSAATHYDPFSAKSDGTGWTSPTSGTNNANSSAEWPSNIDTATSLGLAKWVDGTNYYRPYNGGRVVKWVDENGEIKTSVTVMPPNAKSIGDSGTLTNGTAKSNGSAPNDNFRPTFEAHTSNIDEDLLSEVAKTFHVREFGNGAANQGTGGTYADVSMLAATVDDIAYVMDDGLTGLSGDDVHISATNFMGSSDGDGWYVTFIGTGISFTSGTYGAGIHQIAQNLPYGTHILKCFRDSDTHPVLTIDGVNVQGSIGTYSNANEFTFHQPKRPPIPEDACVIADYMLMADFVAQSTTVTEGQISKGVRVVSASRDHFYNGTSTFEASALLTGGGSSGFQGIYGLRSGVSQTAQLPFFGTRFLMGMEASDVAHELTINGTSVTEDVYDCSANNGFDLKGIPNGSVATLGLNTAKITFYGSNLGYRFWGTHVDSPIHTSHHYKSFETPFLHELIGGDRNMEQTHLICSADGKTWDEVTRDTSYIGNVVLSSTTDTETSWSTYVILDEWRGPNSIRPRFNKKNFAIAYDRVICLVSGQYILHLDAGVNQTGLDTAVYVNTDFVMSFGGTLGSGQDWVASGEQIVYLQRGDYIQIRGDFGGNPNGMGVFQQNKFIIKKA